MKTYEIEIESTDYYTVTVETVKDIETAKEIAFQEVFEGGMSPDFTSNDLVKVKVIDRDKEEYNEAIYDYWEACGAETRTFYAKEVGIDINPDDSWDDIPDEIYSHLLAQEYRLARENQ